MNMTSPAFNIHTLRVLNRFAIVLAFLMTLFHIPLIYADAQFDEIRTKALQGDAESQDNLCSLFGRGAGVAQDYKEAAKWCRKAAEQGLARTQFVLGVYYFKGRGVEKNDKEAVKWYRKSAAQGYADAQYNLGYM